MADVPLSEEYKRSIANIRREFYLAGHSLDQFTDEELKSSLEVLPALLSIITRSSPADFAANARRLVKAFTMMSPKGKKR